MNEYMHRKRNHMYPYDGSVSMDDVDDVDDVDVEAEREEDLPPFPASLQFLADRAGMQTTHVRDYVRMPPLSPLRPPVDVPVVACIKAKVDDPPEKVCGVCMANRKDIAFQCGHIYCGACAPRVDKCPECRAHITVRIKLYGLHAS